MIIRKSIIKFLIPSIIYVLVIASNNMSVPGYYERTNVYLYSFLLILGIYLYFFYSIKPGLFILPKFLQFIFIILIISSILNSMVIEDLRIVITYFSFIFIFLTISKFSAEMTNYEIEITNSIIIFKSIIWINLLFIILSLVVDGLYIFRYQGIFDMPNSMGRFSGLSFIFSLICILFFDKEKFFKIISAIVLILSLIFLIVSNSRAPLFASAVSLVILVSTYSIIKKNKIKMFLILTFFVLVVGLILNYFLYEIIDIFKSKFFRGDGTSGRYELWIAGLNYFSFFGSSEYNDISYKYDVHNNYLNQALKYGIVNSVSFHLIPIYLLFKSFKKMKLLNKPDPHLAVILGMSSFLAAYYVFETASVIAPFWLMIIFTGISYKKIWNNESKYLKNNL